MTWYWWLIAAWAAAQVPVAILICRVLRDRPGRLEALADLTREPPRTLTQIIAATPGLVIYGCGCRPCPPHAAAQAARDKARAARDEWAAEWNERLHKP